MERVMEACLGTKCFGEEVRLWNIALLSDEHANGAASVYNKNFGLVGGMGELHFMYREKLMELKRQLEDGG